MVIFLGAFGFLGWAGFLVAGCFYYFGKAPIGFVGLMSVFKTSFQSTPPMYLLYLVVIGLFAISDALTD